MLVATDLDGTLVPNDAVALPPFTASVLRRLDEAGVPVVFVTARPLRWLDALSPHVGDHGMAIWTEPAVKLMVRHPGVHPDVLHRQVEAVVGDAATVTWSVAGLVEISAPGITKASALRDLCGSLGVGAADVVAFGDMPNDIPMLTWAGTSYAVANAHDSVRRVAQHIAPPCAEEGVAQVLERLLDAG
jgi:hydroxymethylpyrimidine pyrophosphatase-like HAD family hydrolase